MSYERPEPNFNPLPSHEGRPVPPVGMAMFPVFQSTPLTRGETKRRAESLGKSQFQSTPLTRGETESAQG